MEILKNTGIIILTLAVMISYISQIAALYHLTDELLQDKNRDNFREIADIIISKWFLLTLLFSVIDLILIATNI